MARPFSMADPDASPNTPDFWRAQIKAAQDKKQPYVKKWKDNIASYLCKTFSAAEVRAGHMVWVPLDYANTEMKRSQLMFRVPEVQLSAKKPQFETAVPVFQAVLNHTLGRHGVDARVMLKESMFDAICPSGLAVTMIGYEPTVSGTKPVQVGTQPDPNAAPSILGLSVPQVPVYEQVPNVIHEAYYWVRVSPEKVLIPADFHGSNYDLAPWLGVDFEMDAAVAKRKGWLQADSSLSGDAQPQGLNEAENRDAQPTHPKVNGTMIFYCMAHFEFGQPHPEAFGWCVLIDGREDFAVKPSPSPWQKFVPDETGKLHLIGMKGNPIHIKGARYVSDSAYPPSDVQMGLPQSEELSKFRGQMIRNRDRNVPIRGYDKSRVDKDTVTKIEKAEEQSLIGFEGNPSEQLVVLGAGPLPRENYEIDRIIKQDHAGSWALGSNQRAQDDDTTKTATEASIIERSAETRLAYEQDDWADWFVRGAEKLGGLIQLFADDPDYVKIVGEDGLPKLQPWDKMTVAGEFVYSAVPDTSIRQDATTKRRRALDQFQLLANEPQISRSELARWLVRELNLPPQLYNPTPPEKGPEPMRLQLTIRSESLNPALPEFNVIKAVLEQQGIQIPDEAITTGLALQSKIDQGGMADPALTGAARPGQALGAGPQMLNPGPAEKVSPLDKRAFDESGQLPGAGQAPAVN